MQPALIVDVHEDLAYNVLSDGRDYPASAYATRAAEADSTVAPANSLWLSDRVIKGLIARDGVVGVMPLNWALDPDWRAKTKQNIHLDAVVEAIDVVCQLAGDARHVGLGTDFDGGQGAELAPAEIDAIADVPLLAEALRRHGYGEEDVKAIMSGNWLRVLNRSLPRAPA